MQKTGWTTAALGVAALTAVIPGAKPAAADDAPDPAVLATRTQAAAELQPAGYQAPATVQKDDIATPGRMADLYTLNGTNTAAGYVHVGARDNPAQDSPGYLTTTLHIYGNSGAFRDGNGAVSLTSQFTCSGIGISSLTIGSGGASVTGGTTSSTLTWKTSRTDAAEARQNYAQDGNFRCKAGNAAPAKTTHRAVAQATYKNTDTRAEDSYSFWW